MTQIVWSDGDINSYQIDRTQKKYYAKVDNITIGMVDNYRNIFFAHTDNNKQPFQTNTLDKAKAHIEDIYNRGIAPKIGNAYIFSIKNTTDLKKICLFNSDEPVDGITIECLLKNVTYQDFRNHLGFESDGLINAYAKNQHYLPAIVKHGNSEYFKRIERNTIISIPIMPKEEIVLYLTPKYF